MLLLLLNKTVKPLDQFAKKKKNQNPKEVSVFGATADDFHFLTKYFHKMFFSITYKFL